MKKSWVLLLSLCALMGAHGAETLRAFQSDSTVDIWVGEQFFTSYRYNTGEKLPYFFPVNSASGTTLTTVRHGSYPHHASLWFGCDSVNGGNYWQNAMESGRIISEEIELVGAQRGTTADLLHMTGPEVVIKQVCIWRRPNAPEPFRDTRQYVITATPTLRVIDTTITLEALIDVKINKTNHSFFSLRATPTLSVRRGGMLVNAEGLQGEKDTFGKPSPWMAFYGKQPGSGQIEGIALCQHSTNPWYPAPWFTRDYGFISPTPMFWPQKGNSTQIPQGEKLVLRYQTIVFVGTPEEVALAEQFDKWGQGADAAP